MIIFDYDNYISYLNDWFKEQKLVNTKFSHQFFAKKAGFKSRSFMANIITGERTLGVKYIHQVAHAMNLNAKESKYFEALVHFKESKELNQKNHFYSLMQKLKPQTKLNILKKKQNEYFQCWYYPVLRELLSYFDFKGDFKLLGQQLVPPINATEARNAVQLLLDLELIREVYDRNDANGIKQNKKRVRYEQTENVVLSDNSEESITVRNFQNMTLDLAKAALNEQIKNDRNFLTYTFSVDKEGKKEINELLNEFQEKLIAIVNSCRDLSSTHQVNIQFFPLTEIIEK